MSSGVTKVGDTRGGNRRCHPSIYLTTFLDPSSAVSPLTTFLDDLFAHRFIAFYCCHSGVSCVTRLEGVTLHLFYLSDLVSPLFFVNLPTKFFHSIAFALSDIVSVLCSRLK